MLNENRRRILDIMRLLHERTDDEHWITSEELRDELEAMGYDRPNRKTIEPNIQFLMEDWGMDIEKERGLCNRYRLLSRRFEMAELKLLVDAVQSSRFISEKRSKDIIAKLKSLASNAQAEQLERKIITPQSFKRENSAVLYSIDAISEAIKNNRRITFQMVDYDAYKKEVLRHEGRIHDVSPYALIWNNDYYYMLGMAKGETKVKPFRIDRMKNTEVTGESADPQPADFNQDKYSCRVFDMFGGDPAEVRLSCRPYIMNYLIDRFGREFRVTDIREDGSFTAYIVVEESPTFYAWVFQFGGDIIIEGPEKVRREFGNMVSSFTTEK